MLIARQSTARTVTIGPVLDSTGVAVTDCVVGDFKISKNGGAPAALNGSATLTHRNTGHYSLALTASDLDTVGQAEVVIDDSTNAAPIKEITIVEEAVYDALFVAAAAGYQVPIWASASSTVSLTNTTVATVTTLTNAPSDSSGTTTLLSRLTSTRAGYLDNLSAGAVALEATAQTIVADTNELQTDWANGGRLDNILDARASQTSVDTIDGIVDAILVDTGTDIPALIADVPTVAEFEARTLVAAAYGTAANQMTILGYIDTEVAAILAAVDTEVAAIKAKTDNLPSDPADASDIAASFASIAATLATISAYLDTEIAAILEDTGTTLPAQIAALNNLSAAQVKTQVVDALATDTYAEPAAVPAATASLKDKIGWLAILARNRMLQTAALQSIRNDANSANVGTAAVSDDGTTAERSEWS